MPPLARATAARAITVRLTTVLSTTGGEIAAIGLAPAAAHAAESAVPAATFTVSSMKNAGTGSLRAAGGSSLLGVSVTGASGNGVTLRAGQVTINDDYVGLELAGKAEGNAGNGVYAAGVGEQIGQDTSSASGAVANVISANGGAGVVLAGAGGSTVAANRIGTRPNGKAAAGNGGGGIIIDGGSVGNEIGGTRFVDSATGKANNPTGDKGKVTPVFVVPPDGNLISGNSGAGVLITGGSGRNALNGNFIGTTADGDSALGNTGDGVDISGSDGNSLTGCRFVNNPFVYYNVISGNGGDGLQVSSSNKTVVQGNFFGVGAKIGGRNLISGNTGNGVTLRAGSSGNLVVGNYIGLNRRGGALPNSGRPVANHGTGNKVTGNRTSG